MLFSSADGAGPSPGRPSDPFPRGRRHRVPYKLYYYAPDAVVLLHITTATFVPLIRVGLGRPAPFATCRDATGQQILENAPKLHCEIGIGHGARGTATGVVDSSGRGEALCSWNDTLPYFRGAFHQEGRPYHSISDIMQYDIISSLSDSGMLVCWDRWLAAWPQPSLNTLFLHL